jgi:hypothetical protein
VYLVDSKNFKPAVLKAYRETLPNNEKNTRVVKIKVLGLVPGSRSYECQVLGLPDKVKLSSKSLSILHSSGSHQQAPQRSETSSEEYVGSGGSEEDDSGADSAADAGPVDAPVDASTNFASTVASDWLPVADFEDQVTTRFPTFDIGESARLRGNVPKTPCDLFLAFFPLELVEPCFEAWRKHAAEHDRLGLGSLDKSMMMRFLALLLKMGAMGLRRRDHYFAEGAPMTQPVFQNLIYTIRDVGFPAYPEGEPLTDGRTVCENDPLRRVRRFADDLQHAWQELVVPGSVIVADETMVGWTGATNIHITVLPNKPTSRGVCLKTLCDARTRVMVGFEFVEARAEQQLKRYAVILH